MQTSLEFRLLRLVVFFNGRTKPTLNTVEAIKGKFPKISLDWLMYGTEPMFNDEATEAKNESNMDALPTNLIYLMIFLQLLQFRL